MIVYTGKRPKDGEGSARVWKDGVPFHAGNSWKLRCHSPDGFNWGYCGSGPAQLALALLQDVLGDFLAVVHYQDFKRQVISDLSYSWIMSDEYIRQWYEEIPRERRYSREDRYRREN